MTSLVVLVGSILAVQPLVFRHVTVIDATGRPPLADRTVVLNAGRIQSIGIARDVKVPKGAQVVDATGKYMIPGLWDMHMHFRGGPALIPDNEAWLSVFLANGITGIREMGGDIPETVFRWRDEIASGKRIGPRILSAGPKLDGPKPIWPGSIPVTDPETARAAVDKVKAMGADFVKIYSPSFTPEVLKAITAEGRKQHLMVGGHMPFQTMTTREAIDAGVKFIEHVEYYVFEACTPKERELNQEFTSRIGTAHPMTRYELLSGYAQTYDESLARDLMVKLIDHDVWVTPTLAIIRQLESMGRVDWNESPERKYIFPGIWATWDPKGGRRHPVKDEDLARLPLIREKTAELVRLLQSMGVGLLAGSDSGASNNFSFPGWLLHRELALLVENGLTPMQALQCATRNPARFIGDLPTNGTVEEGKIANVVLLTANPLEDIQNTRKIDSVVLKGRLFTREDLDHLLESVAAHAAAAQPSAP